MRIGIDARVFAGGKRTGVEEYTQHFLETLFTRESGHKYILFYNKYKNDKVDLTWATNHKNVTLKEFRIPNKLLNFSLWWLHYPKIDKLVGGLDVFFMPNNNFIALSDKCRLILTVHDLSYIHHKNTFSKKRRLWHWFVNPRLLTGRAHHILAVSQSTKDDLMSSYHIGINHISVAHNGKTDVVGKLSRNDPSVLAVKEKYNLPYKFILSFSTIEPRKNIVHIVKAFEIFRSSANGASYKLVIAGASGWHSEHIDSVIASSHYTNDIIRITDVPTEDKEPLYVLSDLFVYPSLYEGFGFPPLEAMRTNTPIIASHSSSLPEVVGKNGILVDPHRPEEIAHAMREILTQKKLRDQLLCDHEKHLSFFSWQRVTDTFLRNIS